MSNSSVVAIAVVLMTAVNLIALLLNTVWQGDSMRSTSVVEHKIQPTHLGRKAIVYLRQSSERQVRENIESQRLQYAMAEKARSLGWSHVEVIDTDLGCSASVGAKRRDGFERVVAQVSMGEVGIIFSYELSRLSRTDRDWCQLFEICPLVDVHGYRPKGVESYEAEGRGRLLRFVWPERRPRRCVQASSGVGVGLVST